MRATKLIIGAILLAATGAAKAQAQEPPPAVITNPSWAQVPDPEVLGEAHPAFAAMAGLPGVATLRCVARADGGLSACEVVEAAPRGLGFDRAALSVVPRFRVAPRTVNGEEAKSTIQFNIRFTTDGDQPVLPWTGPEPTADHLRNTRAFIDGLDVDLAAELEASLQNLGVDADREDKVRAIVRQAHAEFAERKRAATALAMARLITPEQLTMAATRTAMPPQPSEETFRRAGDQALALDNEETARTRTLYCAQFECLSPAEADALRR